MDTYEKSTSRDLTGNLIMNTKSKCKNMVLESKFFALFFMMIIAITCSITIGPIFVQEPTPMHTPSHRYLTPLTTRAPDYLVSASAGIGGTISPSGFMSATPGSSCTFAITPNPGYEIQDVVDRRFFENISKGAISTYTLTNIYENHEIFASFSMVTIPTITPTPTLAPTPTVPEFTLIPIGPSFDIPPNYSFNSNTGQFDIKEGYHIQYSTVKIIIKNQQFTNQSDNDHFYYNVRLKPHNYPDKYWQELFSAGADGYPIQTVSNYTTVPIAVEGTQAPGPIIPTGVTTDIQVEAMIGHIGRNNTMNPYPYPYVFFGETSGWSNTQTITLPPKTDFTASPSLTPSVPETSTIAIIMLLFAGIATLLLAIKRQGDKKPLSLFLFLHSLERRLV
jgi:hypothetical protein